MKRKFKLLILTMLLSVSFMQAQTTDVWDFGATQLTGAYDNKLDVVSMNALFTGTSGSTGATNTVGNTTFTTGILSWVGGSDRLRTTNTALTRYDQNVANVADATTYRGRLYANGFSTPPTGLPTAKYFAMTLAVDDEVTIIARCDGGIGALTFAYVPNIALQKDVTAITSDDKSITEVKFVAKKAGEYRIYDQTQKASYYRITRKAASYKKIEGNVDVTQAVGIPNGYLVKFTNPAGKTWTTAVTPSGTYSVNLPAGYTYQMSLDNANGYIISNGDTLAVTDAAIHNINILKVDSFTVSGSVTGLADVTKLTSLTYTPNPAANKIYVPKPVITGSTYTVDLEPNTQYTVSGQGVNDYELLANSITITGNKTANVDFTTKPIYPITITTTGLDPAQIASLTLTFTNFNESGYVYTFAPGAPINLRTGTYVITYSGLNASVVVMTLTSHLKVTGAATSKILDFVAPAPTSALPYEATIYVGTDKTYKTINAALAAVTRMTSRGTQRVTIVIDPGNYEEMLDITQVNVTLKNAATTPSIGLLNKGVDIDPAAVRITSYYGIGYNYYSMKSNQKWDADVLRVNVDNGFQPYINESGTKNNSYWNATLLVSANGFIADDIIIENSFNQYISLKESLDKVELAVGGSKTMPIRWNDTTTDFEFRSTKVQDKAFVERAAAIAIKDNIDKVILNKCRVVGRQDSFFGGKGARVVVYKGVMMGATDYIFGGMTAVFYQCDLAMNTSDHKDDTCYITAPQQEAGRGYLMYECKVTSAVPGTETASTMGSKPGYFGRPWQATTSEVVFYNTTIETSTYNGAAGNFIGKSLIKDAGWNDSLNTLTRSDFLYEYGSIEQELDGSGQIVNNSGLRTIWTNTLAPVTAPAEPTMKDGKAINTDNFTEFKSNANGVSSQWGPLTDLIAADPLGTKKYEATSTVNVFANKNSVVVSNVKSNTTVSVYGLNGALVTSFNTDIDTNFNLNAGVWVVVVQAADGQKAVKVMTY